MLPQEVLRGPSHVSWWRWGGVEDGVAVVIEQGYAMGRPSLIKVAVSGSSVRVEGRGFVVAEGNLRVFLKSQAGFRRSTWQ